MTYQGIKMLLSTKAETAQVVVTCLALLPMIAASELVGREGRFYRRNFGSHREFFFDRWLDRWDDWRNRSYYVDFGDRPDAVEGFTANMTKAQARATARRDGGTIVRAGIHA